MSPESPDPNFGRPVARAIRLADFDAASGMFASWQGRFEQLSRGPFRGTLRIFRGGLVRVGGIEANQRVLLRGHDAARLVSVYPVTALNAACVWQGHQLAPGQLVVHGTGAETDHYSARQTTTVGVSLRSEALVEAARALLNTEVVGLPQTWTALSPPPEAFAGLSRQLSRLLNLGVTDPTLMGTPENDVLEQECVRALVAVLFSAAPQQDLTLPARARMLRRAEDYMRSRLADPVGAIDLCRELGVNDRTLRLAFCERYGIGPLTYFKEIRLNAVRSCLKGTPNVLIADLARTFGFHHMSNFATHYRRLFGERPSETPRGDAGNPPDQETFAS